MLNRENKIEAYQASSAADLLKEAMLGMSKSAYISMIINKQEEGGRRVRFA